MAEKFNKILGNFKIYWEGLNKTKKLSSIVGLAIILGIILTLIIRNQNTNMRYLFVNISEEDTASITTFMKQNGISNYIVDNKGIKVNEEKVDHLRLILSQEGLPYNGIVGWESFDEGDFTKTDFEQEVQKLRAIQGELSRTITSIDGINSTRVHIVLPKKSLFVREKKEPTASIYLQTKRGFELEKKQVRGIQFLVSKAVENLKTNNIVIIGSNGEILTNEEATDNSERQSNLLLKFKKQIEKSREERIKAIVGRVVGPDRVEAKVDADVDFTKEKQTIQNVDPEDVVVVSKNTSGFSMEGSGINPTGIPGSKSNIPGENNNNITDSSKASSERENELINYEFSKVVSERTLAVGTIKRLTISTIVDGKQVYPIDGSTPEFEPRTSDEIKKIEELIKDAVGYKEGRDSLTVHNMMFQLDPFQLVDAKRQRKEDRVYMSTLMTSAVIALALILFFAFVVRPYFRWLSYDPERKEDEAIIEEYKPEIEVSQRQAVQVQEELPFDQMTTKEQVLFIAKNEPKRTTEAIKILIEPSQS